MLKILDIVKAKLSSNKPQKGTDRKPPTASVSALHQPLSTLNGDPLTSELANDDVPSAQQKTGRTDKGKDRANSQKNTRHNPSSKYRPLYQENLLSNQRQASEQLSTTHVQYVPHDTSRDGPSGGFFEGSSNMEINGGHFNQTYGHHTNVTINVNQPREYDTSQQYISPPPLASPGPSEIYNNIALPVLQDIYRRQFPSVATSEQGVNDIPDRTPQNLNNISAQPSMSTTIYSPDNSNKIYERHLNLKKKGFPLWIPEPNRNLGMPYRRKGVSIGDVGIITPSGGFSFLFNICLPHDNPINSENLPDGFVPIDPPIKQMDIRECAEYNSDSYLASTAIQRIPDDSQFRGLSFSTSAAEGAILTLPEGAIAFDLENVSRVRAYAAMNIENWYRYVNGPRGREANNGEVRLIIGCHKATSWGVAAIANMTQDRNHYLKYRSVGDSGPTTAPIPLYKWEYTGLGEARVGPGVQEIEDLKRNDDSDVAVDGKYWNQCLFVRTLNLKLNDDVFTAINQELESALIQESQQLYSRSGPSNSTNSPSNAGAQVGSTGQQPGTNSTTQAGSTSKLSGSTTGEFKAVGSVVRKRVTTSRSPSEPVSHPADVLNKVLLQKFPNSRVVITHDEDWCSIINEDDKIMPNLSEIAERVLASHHIREEDGVVFLERKIEGHMGSEFEPILKDWSRLIMSASVTRPPTRLSHGKMQITDTEGDEDSEVAQAQEKLQSHCLLLKIQQNNDQQLHQLKELQQLQQQQEVQPRDEQVIPAQHQPTNFSYYPVPDNALGEHLSRTQLQRQAQAQPQAHTKVDKVDIEAQRQQDVFMKLSNASFLELSKVPTNSVGLLTQLIPPTVASADRMSATPAVVSPNLPPPARSDAVRSTVSTSRPTVTRTKSDVISGRTSFPQRLWIADLVLTKSSTALPMATLLQVGNSSIAIQHAHHASALLKSRLRW